MALELIPKAVRSRPQDAQRRVSAIVAAATAGAALAGLWIRVEDGLSFRLVLAATSAFFGWLTIQAAFGAKDGASAAMRAISISVALGAVSTVIPCFMLSEQPETAFLYVPFAGILGAITGFLYGVVLAIVAAATWNQITAGTHEGADRAVRIAAVWAVVPMAFIAMAVFAYDYAKELPEWASESQRSAHALAVPLGVVGLGIVFNVAAASFWAATRRLAQRTRWIEDVAMGIHPRLAIRAVGPYDDLGHLPRLRHGFNVLEHRNEHAVYRANAASEPIAIV